MRLNLLKRLALTLAVLFALGATATTAFSETLPDVSAALGGIYPLHLNFADNGKTVARLETTSGGVLENSIGFSVLLLLNELSALGTYTESLLMSDFFVGHNCHTEGDEEGVTLIAGMFHFVLVVLW